jgi:hypothetical protein
LVALYGLSFRFDGILASYGATQRKIKILAPHARQGAARTQHVLRIRVYASRIMRVRSIILLRYPFRGIIINNT